MLTRSIQPRLEGEERRNTIHKRFSLHTLTKLQSGLPHSALAPALTPTDHDTRLTSRYANYPDYGKPARGPQTSNSKPPIPQDIAAYKRHFRVSQDPWETFCFLGQRPKRPATAEANTGCHHNFNEATGYLLVSGHPTELGSSLRVSAKLRRSISMEGGKSPPL
jgi:hypothetical protein